MEIPDDLSSLDDLPEAVMELDMDFEGIPSYSAIAGFAIAEVICASVVPQAVMAAVKRLSMDDDDHSRARIMMSAIMDTIGMSGEEVERRVIVSFRLNDPTRTWSVTFAAENF